MNLPADPMILLSFVNIKLRDSYSSLDALCDDLEVEKESLIRSLDAIDYHYDSASNRFV